MDNWNLSDRIINQEENRGYPLDDQAILKEDVREFIKKLKDEFRNIAEWSTKSIHVKIDKLAGEKLI